MSDRSGSGGAHWRHLGLFCAALAAVSLFGGKGALAQDVRYFCDNGVDFAAQQRRGGETLMLSFGPHKVLLDATASSFGERYAGGGYLFLDQRHSILLTRPDEEPVVCYAEGRRQPGGPGGDRNAGPSFPCGGRLVATERRICAAPPLARLDRRMAEKYEALSQSLGGRDRARLRSDQDAWLVERNACGDNFRCIEDNYFERITALNEWNAPTTPPRGPVYGPYLPPTGPVGRPLPPPPPPRASLPRQAVTWGGIVRSGPGTQFNKLATLAEGDPVTILADTGIAFNGYRWFEVRAGGLRGFQWGGIICPIGAELPGTYKSC